MKNSNLIPVLEKAIRVMEYIGAHPGQVGQAELKNALKLPQATCYRIVATLLEHHWLVRVNGNAFDIAGGLLPVARKAMFRLDRYQVLQPVLEQLAKKVGYSVKLSVRDGEEQVNVLSAKAPWDVALTAAVGSREHLTAGGSVGVVLAAALDERELQRIDRSTGRRDHGGMPLAQLRERIAELQEKGHCFNPAAGAVGIDALSVPIRDEHGRIGAALTLLAMPGELHRADRAALAEEMHSYAARMSNSA